MNIVITGNSGVGKSTFIRALMAGRPNKFLLFDHDAEVERLYETQDVKDELHKSFGVFTKLEVSQLLREAKPEELYSNVSKLHAIFSVSMRMQLGGMMDVAEEEAKDLLIDFPNWYEADDMSDLLPVDLVFVLNIDEEERHRRLRARGVFDGTIDLIQTMQYSSEYKLLQPNGVAIELSSDMLPEDDEYGRMTRRILDFFKQIRWIKHAVEGLVVDPVINYNLLAPYYFQEHRKHHNLNHIIQMLGDLQNIVMEGEVPIESVTALVYAILFHDVVYNPERKDNEALSAARFIDNCHYLPFLPTLLNPKALIAAHILSTAKHETPRCWPLSIPELAKDNALLHDLDFAILATENIFRYEYNIRSEYAMFPDNEYHPKRLAFLRNTDAGQIFRTEYFKERMEDKAHENIKKLIEYLESWEVK